MLHSLGADPLDHRGRQPEALADVDLEARPGQGPQDLAEGRHHHALTAVRMGRAVVGGEVVAGVMALDLGQGEVEDPTLAVGRLGRGDAPG